MNEQTDGSAPDISCPVLLTVDPNSFRNGKNFDSFITFLMKDKESKK